MKGSVLNDNNLQPLEGVNVVGEHSFSISSKSGGFTIDLKEEGVYTFKISHVGFEAKTVTVTVKSKIVTMPVFLRESSTSLDEIKVFGKSKKEC
ncbi:carboxypeptidase-like regulatory domain-containing protein [Polaribacter sejongensis]|uniref:carboxypeptidase-like regulatory domain-containing protein n=1 Tax=Polaribacter sejongensis TaxID=985043 RepID=UPI0035A679C6